MKPTKEQLADPSWWNNNAKLKDKYCYMNEKTGECFTTWHFDDGVHGFELLAKRPEPDWVPEVGEWCMRGEKGSKHSYKVFMIGYNSEGFPVFENLPYHDSITCDTGHYEYKPIKTQREELIDLINKHDGCTTGLLVKHILARFDLTEKDGE